MDLKDRSEKKHTRILENTSPGIKPATRGTRAVASDHARTPN